MVVGRRISCWDGKISGAKRGMLKLRGVFVEGFGRSKRPSPTQKSLVALVDGKKDGAVYLNSRSCQMFLMRIFQTTLP